MLFASGIAWVGSTKATSRCPTAKSAVVPAVPFENRTVAPVASKETRPSRSVTIGPPPTNGMLI